MKLKPVIQIIVTGAAILTLAACSTGRKQGDVNSENQAYSDAASSGVDDGSSFGDSSGRRFATNGKVYYFDYDSNVIHDADKPAIIKHADKLATNSGKAMLEGHTDPRGSREYNIGLGERRAKSVAELMASKGVKPSQLRVVSYGAEKPASPGTSAEDYQLDRRVVLVYPQG